MNEALLRLAPHVRSRLAKALAAGLIDDPTPQALRAQLGTDSDPEGVSQGLRALAEKGVFGVGAGAWLGALGTAADHRPRTDVVWSGSELEGVASRDTRAVYDELLGRAERSLWVSSYVYFDGPRAFAVLADRMDAVSDLDVRLLLNLRRKTGDDSNPSDLVRRFADRLWKHDWPGTRRPTVYYDPRSVEPDGPSGVLHAKAVVADEESLFVTSANLTEAAMDKNIELGLLVRDRALALSVVRHFQVLIERGDLRALPE